MKTLIRFILFLSLFIVNNTISHAQVTQEWIRSYNGIGTGNTDDAALSIAVDNAGNSYVTGYRWGGAAAYDIATIKYNSTGVQQWVKIHNGTANGSDEGKKIAIDGLGNIYVTGYSTNSLTGEDLTTIKYNSNGDTLWVRRYNGPGNSVDGGSSIAFDASNR